VLKRNSWGNKIRGEHLRYYFTRGIYAIHYLNKTVQTTVKEIPGENKIHGGKFELKNK